MNNIKESIRVRFDRGEMTPSSFNCFLTNFRVGGNQEDLKYLLHMAAKYNFHPEGLTETELYQYSLEMGYIDKSVTFEEFIKHQFNDTDNGRLQGEQ